MHYKCDPNVKGHCQIGFTLYAVELKEWDFLQLMEIDKEYCKYTSSEWYIIYLGNVLWQKHFVSKNSLVT